MEKITEVEIEKVIGEIKELLFPINNSCKDTVSVKSKNTALAKKIVGRDVLIYLVWLENGNLRCKKIFTVTRGDRLCKLEFRYDGNNKYRVGIVDNLGIDFDFDKEIRR